MFCARLLSLSRPVCGRALRRWALAVALLPAALALPAPPAAAQVLDPVPTDLYDERPRNEGNRIAFCLRPASPLAEFEAELAQAIGRVLLTEVRTHTVPLGYFPVHPTQFDFYFGLADEQMFVLMAERCDVLLGMYLTSGAPEWLRLSRPYLTARILGVSADPAIRRITDLKPGAKIGVQALASGDGALTSYVRTLRQDSAPERAMFRDNRALFTAIAERRVEAALIWEGALMVGTGGDPGAAGLYVMEGLPFPVNPIEISGAVRVRDNFLGALVDEAITALEADGTLAEMAARHRLLLPAGTP